MIKVENLYFYYEKKNIILKNLNFSFMQGKVYLIIGNNGAGKTTFIRILLGILKPSSGRVVIADNLVISYLPDCNGIYEDLTILDNIKFRLSLYKIHFDEKINLYKSLLKKYNLTDQENHKVSELSLGMKKKVALIAALLIDADIFILDEPTGGVDLDSRGEIINMLNEFKKNNKLIICITHEKELIKNLDAEIITLKNGGFM